MDRGRRDLYFEPDRGRIRALFFATLPEGQNATRGQGSDCHMGTTFFRVFWMVFGKEKPGKGEKPPRGKKQAYTQTPRELLPSQ